MPEKKKNVIFHFVKEEVIIQKYQNYNQGN